MEEGRGEKEEGRAETEEGIGKGLLAGLERC